MWHLAALSWDGAYYLFNALDDGVPFTPLGRSINAPLQAPVLLARGLTEDLSILRPLFVAPYALLTPAALALAWWSARPRPSLFAWPVLAVLLANLPGALFLTSEGPTATAFFWPLLLALLTRTVLSRWHALALALGATIVLAAHPIAAPLFLGWAALALLLDARRLWPLAALAAALAVAKAVTPLSGYETESLSPARFADAFRATVVGWPLVSLTCTALATLLVWVQPKGVLRFAPAALALAAGVALVPWARDPTRWANALDYRFVVNLLSAGFFGLALLEARFRPAGGWPERRLLAHAAALAFLLVVLLQGRSWQHLRARLMEALPPGRCVSLASLPIGSTAMDHWATTSLSIVLQGRAPSVLALPGEACDEYARTGGVRLAPWELRPRGAGWFRLEQG